MEQPGLLTPASALLPVYAVPRLAWVGDDEPTRHRVSNTSSHQRLPDRDRILRQLDKMLASGRLTPEEAERLRSADPAEFEAAVRAISERHMRERQAEQ